MLFFLFIDEIQVICQNTALKAKFEISIDPIKNQLLLFGLKKVER